MLPVNGRPLLVYTLEALRGAGCRDFVVVVGYRADRLEAPGCRVVHNPEYERNNILHSLMYARDFLEGDVLVSYSDIYVEPVVHQRLVATPGDIVLAVDMDWRGYYEGRTESPIQEAEKAYVEMANTEGVAAAAESTAGTGPAPPRHQVKRLGKHLNPAGTGPYRCGEFLGLWKMTGTGARRFRVHFEGLEERLSPEDPFQAAREWRQAYITDFLNDLIGGGTRVDCLLIERGWAEIDTVQDYERLGAIARRQRLFSLVREP